MRHKLINIICISIIIIELLYINCNKVDNYNDYIPVMSTNYDNKESMSLSELINYLEINKFSLQSLEEKEDNRYILDIEIIDIINKIKSKLLILQDLNIINYSFKIDNDKIVGRLSIEFILSV